MSEERIVWICPADNTYNSGKFCVRCGRPRPEDAETKAVEIKGAAGSDGKQESGSGESKQASPAGPDKAGDSAGEKVGEFFGDIAARFSRIELVKDIKADKKKKRIAAASLVGGLLLLYVLFGLLIAPHIGVCALGHRWIEADCTHPEICRVCGRERGEPLPHDYLAATCTEPATCRYCGETSGEALGHDWLPATCEAPVTCSRCGEHNGESLGHVPGETRVLTPPTVLEDGEEELICKLCGEVIGTQPCSLKNYIDGDGFVFSVLDYSKLLLEAKETVLPEVSMLKYKDKTDNDCFAFWLGTKTAAAERVAICTLYDENMDLILLNDENYAVKPYAVRWSFTVARDQEAIKTLMPYILRTLSPAPVDAETLMTEKDMTVDGLRYIYENDGVSCRLTVLTTGACSLDSVDKIFN